MPPLPPLALANTYTCGVLSRTVRPVWSDDCDSDSGCVAIWSSRRSRVTNRR